MLPTVKVDTRKGILTVSPLGSKKVYRITDKTKFVGPRGGLSDDGIKDDRLTIGA